MANVLPKDKQDTIIGALAEGNSIRSIERMTGIHRDTIMRLGVRVGEACKGILDERLRNLNCGRIEVDELWGFIGMKQKRTGYADRVRGMGDVWTYLAIDPETKLIASHLVGQRSLYYTEAFLRDLAARLKNRIQISTDAMASYPEAVERAFGCDVDYAQIVKEYAAPAKEEQRKYSPARLVAVYKTVIAGDPEPEKVCTSYVERANLTMRTHCKRLARLTLAFSKKLENFKAAMALNLAYYNFVKTHGTLRCTPAMAAGVEQSAWSVADLVDAAN
jgi:IS1 family transposase